MEATRKIKLSTYVDQEALFQAVKRYMLPQNDYEQISVQEGNGICIIRIINTNVKGVLRKHISQEEVRSVKIIFQEDVCIVKCHYNYNPLGKSKSSEVRNVQKGINRAYLATTLGTSIKPPLGAMASMVAGVGYTGADILYARKFQKEIFELVESFTGRNVLESKEEQSSVDIQNIPNAGISASVCSCGYQLSGKELFCPNCGKTTKTLKRFCECGQEITEGNFCPNCGKRQE